MASSTLSDILSDAGAKVITDESAPEEKDQTLRHSYINQAIREWGDAYPWKQLREEFTIPFADSGVSIGLPGNFKQLMSPMTDLSLGISNVRKYPDLKHPEERHDMQTTDKYTWILGNDAIGYSLQINPAMTSGFSGVADILTYPSLPSLLTDSIVCPQPNFVSTRAAALELEAQSDPRFPGLKTDADTLLKWMIEEEDAASRAQDNRIPDWARRRKFVIGEDG